MIVNKTVYLFEKKQLNLKIAPILVYMGAIFTFLLILA